MLGTAIVYQVTGGGWSPAYEADDARSWRNECEGRPQALADFLRGWKNKYETLAWIGFPASGWPNVWTESNYSIRHLRVRFFFRWFVIRSLSMGLGFSGFLLRFAERDR